MTHLLQASHEALLQFLQALLLVHPPVTPLQPSSAPGNSTFVGFVPCWRLLPEQRETFMPRMGEISGYAFLRKLQKYNAGLKDNAEIQHCCRTNTQSGRNRTRGKRHHKACSAMVECSKISCHGKCCVVNLHRPCSALGPRTSGSCPWDLQKALVKHGAQIWAEGPVCGGAGICCMRRVGVRGCRPHSCRWVCIHFTT